MIAELFAGLDASNSVNPPPAPYEGGRILEPLSTEEEFQSDFDIDRAAYDEALKKSAMVDRCVTGKAEKGASLPLRVWERDSSGKASPVGDHPLDQLLNHPSSDPVDGSREEVVYRAIMHHQLTGNALIGIRRARDISRLDASGKAENVPHELEAEDPRDVYPVPSSLRGRRLAQWNYTDGDGKRLAWLREDLAHWKRHDPRNPLWGCSVLQSLALCVASSVEGGRTHLLRMARDGRPGMIIADEGIPNPAKGHEAEVLLNARMRNSRGGIMILSGKQTLVASGMSSTDLGILESMRFDRDMIAIAYGYLPAGFSNDAATYSNTGIFVLHEWSLVQSLMASFCSRLEDFLLTREELKTFSIAPDYSGVQVLADANLDKVKLLADLAFKGLSTNDLIRSLGLSLPPQEFGDVPLVPENVQPIAAAISQEI